MKIVNDIIDDFVYKIIILICKGNWYVFRMLIICILDIFSNIIYVSIVGIM